MPIQKTEIEYSFLVFEYIKEKIPNIYLFDVQKDKIIKKIDILKEKNDNYPNKECSKHIDFYTKDIN